MTDILMVIIMLSHSIEHNMNRADFQAADLDFPYLLLSSRQRTENPFLLSLLTLSAKPES